MAKNKEELEKEIEETAEELKTKGVQGYEKLIDRLDQERNNIRRELDRDYKEARRYVRSNPEEGVLLGILGGLAIGFLFGRLNK